MKRVIRSSESIMCMANVRGKFVTRPHSLPFSFYFSSKEEISHGPRVKPVFNPDRLLASQTGDLKLCDDWEFIPGENDKGVRQKDINRMKQFFRDNIVLFCAVWDEQLQDGILEDYLTGRASFDDMVKDLDFYEDNKNLLDQVSSVEELDQLCRENQLVNFYGN